MTTRPFGGLSETGTLTRLIDKHASYAFLDADAIDAQWQDLNFTAAPDFGRSVQEYDHFLTLIASQGAELLRLERCDDVPIDSIYVRDASLVTPHGVERWPRVAKAAVAAQLAAKIAETLA